MFKRLPFSQMQRQNPRNPEQWFQAGTAWGLNQAWSAAQKHAGMEMHLQLRRLLRAVEEQADPKEYLTRMLEVYANVEGQSGHDEEAQEEEVERRREGRRRAEAERDVDWVEVVRVLELRVPPRVGAVEDERRREGDGGQPRHTVRCPVTMSCRFCATQSLVSPTHRRAQLAVAGSSLSEWYIR